MKFRKAKTLLENDGWVLNRVKGSHYIYKKDKKEFVLPRHTKDISKIVEIYLMKIIRS